MDPFVACGVDEFHMQHLTQFGCHERVAVREVGFEIDVFRRPVVLPIRVQIDPLLHHLVAFFKIGQFGQSLRIEIGGYAKNGILAGKCPS